MLVHPVINRLCENSKTDIYIMQIYSRNGSNGLINYNYTNRECSALFNTKTIRRN